MVPPSNVEGYFCYSHPFPAKKKKKNTNRENYVQITTETIRFYSCDQNNFRLCWCTQNNIFHDIVMTLIFVLCQYFNGMQLCPHSNIKH